MNGLDRSQITVPGFRGGQVYRNEGGDGPDDWFYHIGSDSTQGPFPSRQAAVDDAHARYAVEGCGQCEGTGRTQSASNLEDETCPVCDGDG